MREAFDEKRVEPAQPTHYTDLTLGPVMLLGILLALLLIGALVFGAGYTLGRRGSQDAMEAAKPAPDAQAAVQAGCVQSKPSASAQNAQADPTPAIETTGADQLGELPVSDAGTAANASNAAADTASAASLSQSQIRPALAPAANPTQPASAVGGALNAAPVLPQAATLMVQIAAVSHQEDADVLTSALHKRGYPVTSRREPADNLIHVRIGPFKTRDEANKWSLKLMNDGYNAIVQP
jgi:cell division septation protein DedD